MVKCLLHNIHKEDYFVINRRFIRFQEACIKYGVNEVDVFQTVDLWEKKDISQVTTTIFALGRTVSITTVFQPLTLFFACIENQ